MSIVMEVDLASKSIRHDIHKRRTIDEYSAVKTEGNTLVGYSHIRQTLIPCKNTNYCSIIIIVMFLPL